MTRRVDHDALGNIDAMTTTSNEAQALIARMDNLREDQDVAFATLCDARDNLRDINSWTRRMDRSMLKAEGKAARIEQKTDKALGLAMQAGEKLDVLDGRVAVLEADVKELKTDVKELKTDVAVLKTDVAGLKTDVGELKTDVAGLKTDVGELKTDVAGLKTDVAGLKTDVAGLKTDVGELKTDVAGLKTDVGGLKGDMIDVKALLGEVLDRLPAKA
ncbi:hypothetical protein [Nonomuraea sp. CA-141351]|uniref:hypothetical protein n=1 Tax=Nonomuraea sp. CA-141351 TaxID=3239996 RepID=UPI003D8F6AF8